MASIGAPHGVRGEVRLNVFAEDPLTLRRYNPFQLGNGRVIKLTRVGVKGKGVVAAIEGVEDRDAAIALRGEDLSVPRTRLPRPPEDEFYHVDLIGLEARGSDGARLGAVKAVENFGAGDMLELVGGPVGAVFVPFTLQVVPEINLEGGYLVVDPPAGLLDDEKASAPRSAPRRKSRNPDGAT